MNVRIIVGDCRDVLATMPAESVHCVMTSPPYWGLRDYGVAGQIGLESTYQEFIAEMVAVFREVRRVLRSDGTLWLNLGDSYAGSGKGGNPDEGKQATNRGSQSIGVLYGTGKTAREAAVTNVTRNVIGLKPKDLCGIPWRVAFALQADGWWLRQDIIWSKPNPMPESVTDRCTKAHEYLFMLSKLERYYFDQEAIREPSGRNKRSVWEVATRPFSKAHFATFPPSLIEPCILAGCPKGGTVLDPFGGAGTTGLVADRLQRSAILIELNPEYAAMAENRINSDAPLLVACGVADYGSPTFSECTDHDRHPQQ